MRRAATPHRRAAVLGAVAGALALSVTALGAVAAWPGADSRPAAPAGFRITGSADGLLPGIPGRLTVTVRNPYRWPIRVTSIRVTARGAGACPAANLKTARLRRSIVVRARAKRRVLLPIPLAAEAPNACHRARFHLVFSGWAAKA